MWVQPFLFCVDMYTSELEFVEFATTIYQRFNTYVYLTAYVPYSSLQKCYKKFNVKRQFRIKQ